MGRVAEAKKRSRPTHDPNNTYWTQDTTHFGHRMLCSQGWKPGSRLGSAGAAVPLSADGTPYLRARSLALAYEDGVGIGFTARPPGFPGGRDPRLDMVESILARINGRSQVDVVAQQHARVVARGHAWVERRLGAVRFVHGGLLTALPVEPSCEENQDVVEAAPQSVDSFSCTPPIAKTPNPVKSDELSPTPMQEPIASCKDESFKPRKRKAALELTEDSPYTDPPPTSRKRRTTIVKDTGLGRERNKKPDYKIRVQVDANSKDGGNDDMKKVDIYLGSDQAAAEPSDRGTERDRKKREKKKRKKETEREQGSRASAGFQSSINNSRASLEGKRGKKTGSSEEAVLTPSSITEVSTDRHPQSRKSTVKKPKKQKLERTIESARVEAPLSSRHIDVAIACSS